MFSGGFSGSPGEGGDKGKMPKRPGKEDGGEDKQDADEVLSDWEWTPTEKRRFKEAGIRPTQATRNAEREAQADQDILRHDVPTEGEPTTQSRDPNNHTQIHLIENDAQELRDQTRDAIRSARTGTDNELFKILRERFYGIPVTRRPTEAQILDSVVQYMNITGRMVPRDALMTLAQANWDFEFVVARHFDGAPAAPLPMLEPTVGGGPRSSSELSPPPEGPDEPGKPEEESDSDEDMASLNTQVDREPAIKGRRDDSKLTIKLKTPGDQVDLDYSYPKMVNGTVDFTDSRTIRALNKWRTQIFRRRLGKAREPRARFHPLEKQFLIDAVKDFKRQRKVAGQAVKWHELNWYQVTRDYNTRFAGRRLPGCRETRPERTIDSIRTERNRLKEITDLTGGAPRDQKQASKESETDSDEDENKPKPRLKYPRRGDPAPGKPPGPRSPDSDDEDTYGGDSLGGGMVGIRA